MKSIFLIYLLLLTSARAEEWFNQMMTQDDYYYYFVGISDGKSNQKDALDEAYNNAINEMLKFKMGVKYAAEDSYTETLYDLDFKKSYNLKVEEAELKSLVPGKVRIYRNDDGTYVVHRQVLIPQSELIQERNEKEDDSFYDESSIFSLSNLLLKLEILLTSPYLMGPWEYELSYSPLRRILQEDRFVLFPASVSIRKTPNWAMGLDFFYDYKSENLNERNYYSASASFKYYYLFNSALRAFAGPEINYQYVTYKNFQTSADVVYDNSIDTSKSNLSFGIQAGLMLQISSDTFIKYDIKKTHLMDSYYEHSLGLSFYY